MPPAASAETTCVPPGLGGDVDSASGLGAGAPGTVAPSPVTAGAGSVLDAAAVSGTVTSTDRAGGVGPAGAAGSACATAIRAATVSPTAARRRNVSRRCVSDIDSGTARYPATISEVTADRQQITGRGPSLAAARRPRGPG